MATVVNVNDVTGGAATPEWARRYPPLVTLLVALAIAVIVLPSSLNQPQPRQTTTLELAPVPPTDEKPPPVGNINQLGLGNTSSIAGAGAPGEGLGLGPPGPGEDEGSEGRPTGTKKCVTHDDGIKRQTEDKLSPTCVEYYPSDADNGGATYQGVTREEIAIVFYEDGAAFSTPTARGTDNYPTSELIDLDLPPKQGEVGQVTTRRYWAKYFEERFQLYNRHPHFYIYYGSGGTATPESRQADATQAFAQINKPFATISSTGLSGGSDDFLTFMAKRGVLNFGSFSGRSAEFFQKYPKLIWGYPPAMEQMGDNFVEAVCKMVVPYPTSFGGQNNPNGQKRKFGIVRTADPTYPTLVKLAERVRSRLKSECNADLVPFEATYPRNGFFTDTQSTGTYATNGMLRMRQDGVTTLLWPGGFEAKFSAAAAQIGYYPEWITLGDGLMEANNHGRGQDQNAWSQHVFTITPTVRVVPLREQICYNAYREVDPVAPDSDVSDFACLDYDNLRQLFTGIQVAGPKLGPSSIDRGFHAIDALESRDPRLPACYYEPADYTCVKDAQLMWYDRAGIEPGGSEPGCWRESLNGKRYRKGGWPNAPIHTLRNANDPCNAYNQTQYINNRPPDPGGG